MDGRSKAKKKQNIFLNFEFKTRFFRKRKAGFFHMCFEYFHIYAFAFAFAMMDIFNPGQKRRKKQAKDLKAKIPFSFQNFFRTNIKYIGRIYYLFF